VFGKRQIVSVEDEDEDCSNETARSLAVATNLVLELLQKRHSKADVISNIGNKRLTPEDSDRVSFICNTCK
jgi:hypothetical protein